MSKYIEDWEKSLNIDERFSWANEAQKAYIMAEIKYQREQGLLKGRAQAATQLQQLMIEQRQDELDRMEKAALKGTSKPFTMYEYSVNRRKELTEAE